MAPGASRCEGATVPKNSIPTTSHCGSVVSTFHRHDDTQLLQRPRHVCGLVAERTNNPLQAGLRGCSRSRRVGKQELRDPAARRAVSPSAIINPPHYYQNPSLMLSRIKPALVKEPGGAAALEGHLPSLNFRCFLAVNHVRLPTTNHRHTQGAGVFVLLGAT